MENFDDVLRQADIISLHTKLTPATKGLINAKNFPLIRKGAVIINTGRGEHGGSYALWSKRSNPNTSSPTPPTCLIKNHRPRTIRCSGLPNVIITPHIGSRTFESVQRQASCAVENLTLFLAGKKPIA